MTTFLSIVFIIISILMILIILVQRGRGGGLSGAFGSGGGSSSAFGTKTGDVFTTITVIFFVVFMLLAIWLNWRFQIKTTSYSGTVNETKTEPALPSGPSEANTTNPPLPAGTSTPPAPSETPPPAPAPAPAPASQPK